MIHSPDYAVMSVTMPPVPPGSHAGTFRQTCNRQDCNRVLPSVSHDPQSVFIKCRGFCTVASRCEECEDWDDVVEGTRSYQSRLARHRSRYACSKWQGNASASGNISGGREGSTSISWSCGQFGLLSSSSNTSSRAKQWGCLQTTPQLWHTFFIRRALIHRP